MSGGKGAQDIDDGGGRCCIVSTVELRGQKKGNTNFVLVLGGPQSTNKHNNQLNTRGSDEGWIRLETNGKHRGDGIGSFRGQSSWEISDNRIK